MHLSWLHVFLTNSHRMGGGLKIPLIAYPKLSESQCNPVFISPLSFHFSYTVSLNISTNTIYIFLTVVNFDQKGNEMTRQRFKLCRSEYININILTELELFTNIFDCRDKFCSRPWGFSLPVSSVPLSALLCLIQISDF